MTTARGSSTHTHTKTDSFFGTALRLLPTVLDEVMPLKRNHRADLPDAIRTLSAILTDERELLATPYWSNPRLISAYLRYFLPWNLLRMHRLFGTLPLAKPSVKRTTGSDIVDNETAKGTASDDPVLLDLGSGPLSVPIALWMSDKAWRQTKLTVVCTDTGPHPMELGADILKKLAAVLDEPLLWNIKLLRQPMMKALALQKTPPLLITAGNVLNEWESHNADEEDTQSVRMEHLAQTVADLLTEDAMALFIEPGTRLGGTLCAQLRSAASEVGLFPLSPCTHNKTCPLLGKKSRGWCHSRYKISSEAVPDWLTRLTEQARLTKDTLSYSHLLLAKSSEYAPDTNGTEVGTVKSAPSGGEKSALQVRILSDAFPVPDYGLARYACSEKGLLLLPNSKQYPVGAVVSCTLSDKPATDKKSGAKIAALAGK